MYVLANSTIIRNRNFVNFFFDYSYHFLRAITIKHTSKRVNNSRHLFGNIFFSCFVEVAQLLYPYIQFMPQLNKSRNSVNFWHFNVDRVNNYNISNRHASSYYHI